MAQTVDTVYINGVLVFKRIEVAAADLDSEGVFEFDLAHETDAIREAMRHQQHEAVEIELSVSVTFLVEVEVHVSRE